MSHLFQTLKLTEQWDDSRLKQIEVPKPQARTCVGIQEKLLRAAAVEQDKQHEDQGHLTKK